MPEAVSLEARYSRFSEVQRFSLPHRRLRGYGRHHPWKATIARPTRGPGVPSLLALPACPGSSPEMVCMF